MIERALIEIREPLDGDWDSAPSLTPAEISAILDDPRTWVWSADGNNRMVMLMTTGYADKSYLLVDDLLSQDVCMPAMLSEFAQHVKIHPAQGDRAAPVAADDVVQAQG